MITACLIVSIILICGLAIYYYISSKYFFTVSLKKDITGIKDALTYIGLPVLKLISNNKSYYFIIDTGSDSSHLNSSSDLENEQLDIQDGVVVGMTGEEVACKFCKAKFTINGIEMSQIFRTTNLDDAFACIEEERGLKISGILGTDFLINHNYCIDFKDYIIYKRK